MTSTAATADAMPAGEARPLGITKQSATTKSELAKSSGGAGPSESGANVRGRFQQLGDVPSSSGIDGVRSQDAWRPGQAVPGNA